MHTQWEFGVSGGSFVVFECYLHTYLYIYAKGLGEYGTYQSIYDVRLECRAWTCCLSKRKESLNLSYSAGWADKVENPSSLVPLALGTYVCDESTAWFDSDRLVGCPAAGSRTPQSCVSAAERPGGWE